MDVGRVTLGGLDIISDVGEDVWQDQKEPGAYEQWYFDAVSDDGRGAIAVSFYDNFFHSAKYDAVYGGLGPALGQGGRRFPAVVFSFWMDGRPIHRVICEADEQGFVPESASPGCRIGESSFSYRSADYGLGYLVDVRLPVAGKRTLHGTFEWLSVEHNLNSSEKIDRAGGTLWNIVAPRSDVTGRIEIEDRRGRRSGTRHFRGTGYHDHRVGRGFQHNWIKEWFWGRAHYYDSTVVFCRYLGSGSDVESARLIVVREGEIRIEEARVEDAQYARDYFGSRFPKRLRMTTEEGLHLKVKLLETIDSGRGNERGLVEMTLMLRDGVPRKTTGIAETYASRSTRQKWRNWLNTFGIRRRELQGF